MPAFVQMKNRKEEINDITQPILFTKHRVTKRPEDFGLRLVGGQTEVKASKYKYWQCPPIYLLRLLWILPSNCGNSVKAYVLTYN